MLFRNLMSTVSFNNLSGSYLESALATAVQGAGANTNIAGASSLSLPADNGGLSPLASVMSALQQLQISDPAKYEQVTQQIATNLQSAAETAQAQGNASASTELTQLAADFANSSQSGQLPNIQDLANAIGGHGHGHHRHHSGSSSNDADANSIAAQAQNQLFSLFGTSGTTGGSLDPLSIIQNTLASS